MRGFSFLFSFGLIALVLAISFVAWNSTATLRLGMLPWKEAALVHWLFWSGVAGLIVTLLALKRIVPVLFLVWNAVVLVMLIRGYFFSSFSFGPSTGSLSTALCLIGAAVLATVGSALHMRHARVAKPKAVVA